MIKAQCFAAANRACSLLYSYIRKYSGGTYLLPVNVCPDVPLTFYLANVPFEFVDINRDTLCIDIDKCIEKIKIDREKYAGLLYVRTYGCLHNTEHLFLEIRRWSKLDFKIIDDRCLCLPERLPDFCGADMILYSTGHCKQIDLGHGGLAFYSGIEDGYTPDATLIYETVDEEIIYKEAFKENKPLDIIPNGWLKVASCDYDINHYLNIITEKTESRILQRSKLNKIYQNNLPAEIQLPATFQDWRFNIRVPILLKDNILRILFENELFASSHYKNASRLFKDSFNGIYECSSTISASVINLFNDDHYTEDLAFKTCEIINKTI